MKNQMTYLALALGLILSSTAYAAKSMTVYVKSLTRKIYTLENVSDEETICQLKIKLEPDVGILASKQNLILAGKVLENKKMIRDYNIQNQETLHLVTASPRYQDPSCKKE